MGMCYIIFAYLVWWHKQYLNQIMSYLYKNYIFSEIIERKPGTNIGYEIHKKIIMYALLLSNAEFPFAHIFFT